MHSVKMASCTVKIHKSIVLLTAKDPNKEIRGTFSFTILIK